MEKPLLSALLVVVCTLALLATITANDPELDKDGLLPEQRVSGDCPEFCVCLRSPSGGKVVKCDRITAMQQFNDMATAFVVRSKRPGGGGNAQLQLGERFFLHLQLKSVEAITMVDVGLASIDVGAFQGLDSLTQVNLTNNNLQVLHPDTFASNTELRRLSLSQNPLSFTQKSQTPYFLNVSQLSELDLSSCQLYNILPTTFSALSEVTYLNLAQNLLNVIDPRTFSNMISLEEINLSDNNIQVLHSDLFQNNEELEVLKLSNNPIKTIDNLAIPSLTVLDVSFCRITSITALKLESVTHLNLSGNAIVDVGIDAFSKMDRLTYLDLSNNNFVGQLDAKIYRSNAEIASISLRDNPQMQRLPAGGFQGEFRELSRFDVSNCGLESLTPLALSNMTNLAQLDLSNNAFTTLETGVLPRRLKHLSLAYNKITSLDNLNFPTECQLRQLNLQGNQIKRLRPENFINLPYLTKLQLQSCGMEQIWSNLVDEMPYLKNVHTLNLSNNKLQKITPEDLAAFSELNTLGITSNPLVCNDDLSALIAYLQQAHVDPIIVEEEFANISEKFEWQDIWKLSCKKTDQGKKTQKKVPAMKEEISRKESTSSDYSYNDDEDYEDNSSEESHVPDGDGQQTPDGSNGVPKQLNISASSYQLIVMTVAAIATFLLVISLVLICRVCKQRLMRQRSISRQIRKNYGPIYKPLFDNEHVNSPTTPIMKTRIPLDLDLSSNGHNDEMDTVAYSQTVGRVTYLNKPYKPTVVNNTAS